MSVSEHEEVATGAGSGSATGTGSGSGDTGIEERRGSIPPKREFTWSKTGQVPRDFSNDQLLPRVVSFVEDTGCQMSPGVKIYAQQPVLFYTRTRKKVARARTIHRDKTSGTYFEIGQTLLLPDDYEGWFEIVPPDFGRATCYRSIAEVAEVMPRKFFTRSNLRAVRIQKGEEDEEQKIFERKIPAGSVLRVDSVFTATWKASAITGIFKKSKTEWTTTDVKYLKCIDVDEKEVLLPMTKVGKFSAVYETGDLNKNSVYRMKDIIADLTLPINVRLLFGKAPVVPCIFTGMMSIRETRTDENVIASTVLNTRNVLFELPIETPCRVSVSADEDEYAELDTFKDAQKLCKKYALLYSMMIKLSPEQDTNQKVVQHIPRTVGDKKGDTLALDLIGDISLTDDPQSQFLEFDTDSVQSDDQSPVMRGTLIELKEFQYRESTTTV